MFRKRKQPARDNTDSQATMEQIRRRMVANVAGSEAPAHTVASSEAALAADAAASEYPVLPGAPPSYDSAEQNLAEAGAIGDIIAEASREASSSDGIGGMIRNSMRWYTAPEEAYWSGVLGSVDHILATLRAHDAVVKIHGNAIRSLQEHTATLTQQVSEISDLPLPDEEQSKSSL